MGLSPGDVRQAGTAPKRLLDDGQNDKDGNDEDPAAKRLRVLEETRDIDADSEGENDSSDSDERLAQQYEEDKIFDLLAHSICQR